MSFSSGTYYLICFTRFHSGDIDEWTKEAKTPQEAFKIVEDTMKRKDKNSWTGKAEDEIHYSIFRVIAKRINLKKEIKVKISKITTK